MTPILIVAIVFAVPISAIWSHAWLKAKKMQLEAGGDPRLAGQVQQLAAEADELRKRVEVLETIVTSDAAPSVPDRVRVVLPREAGGLEVPVAARPDAARSAR